MSKVVSQLEILRRCSPVVSPASILPVGATLARSCSSTSSLTGSPSRAALRLPQAPLRQQFALIAPHLAGLDLLVFDQSGLGDAAAELLPKTPPHVGVCLIGGDRPLVPRRTATAWSSASRG